MEYARAVALMHNVYCDVPIYPDRILFTEDLVNYIINDICGIDYRLDRAERFREITYNAFTDSMKAGVYKISATENGFHHNIGEIRTWDKENYYSFADQIAESFLDEGLEPRKFLQFCVCVAVLAKEFLNNGLSNAPNLAAVVIYERLMDFDMLLGGWESLNLAAAQIKEAIDFRGIMLIAATPDTSSTDTSDSELEQMSSSSDTSSDDELLNSETDDNISSGGSQDESKLHVAGSENTSALNTEKCDSNLQLSDVPTVNQRIEPIHDFKCSDEREKCDTATQQEDVKDHLNITEELEDENQSQSCAIANRRPSQRAYVYQRKQWRFYKR